MRPKLNGVKRALLHVGSNNISNGQTPTSVAAQVKGLLRKAKNDFPSIMFGISGVLCGGDVQTSKVFELNKLLLEHCEAAKVPFVDANYGVVTLSNPFAIDGIHLSRQGSAVLSTMLSHCLSGN